MNILKQIKNKVMQKIYRKMLKKMVFCYDFQKGKHGKYVYLSAMLDGESIVKINMTKQTQGIAKWISN